MKRIRQWWVTLRDVNMPLQERMFRFVVTVGLFGLFSAASFGLFLEENKGAVGILLSGWLIFFLIARYTIKNHKVSFGVMCVGTILELVVVPISFFTGGGLKGGAPIWFVFMFAYISILMRGYGRIAFFILNAAIMTICYVVGYLRPELVSYHSDRVAYIDSFACLLLLSGLICLMILFQMNMYQAQWKMSERQREEIVELNRSQSRFFSSMSHEIRTPINTIIGLNEMNLREDLSDEVAENSMHIQQSSRTLLALINDILDMSKIESGKMNIIYAPYETGSMLSDVVEMAWNLARNKGLEFSVNIDETLPQKLIGDEVRIKQILINVLNNAVKYTAEGTVTFSVQYRVSYEGLSVVTYSVSDTGMGIKRENIPYLFSAFRREDEKKNQLIEGTGLGLNIVKQLVDLMDGDIAVNSVYTKGSVFTINIPQKVDDATEVGRLRFGRRDAVKTRSSYKQKFEAPAAHVLIVDDNEVNLMVEEKLLRETKMQVESVTNGEAALVKTIENHYNIIFMDHLMPGMDGIECLHKIRNQVGGLNHQTPVIVLTANTGSDLMDMYRREGFDDYITKPIDTNNLEERLLLHLPAELVSRSAEEEDLEFELIAERSFERKRGVMITTDSVCDLPPTLTRSRRIEVISYKIHTNHGVFSDGREIDANGILSFMADSEAAAFSLDPTPGEFESFFADCLQKAQHIIHITASRKMSSSFGNAMEAASAFSNISVVDSGHMSCGLGLVVLGATKLVDDGLPPDKIVEQLRVISSNIKTGFCLDSLKYLAGVGRVPPRARRLSEAFMMHPIVEITDGVMKPHRMVLGSRERAWKQYIMLSFRKPKGIDKSLLFLAYSGLSNEELSWIREEIKKYIEFDKILTQKVSASSAALFGPGTFGLLYGQVVEN